MPLERLLKLAGEHGVWNAVGKLHMRVYQLTGGRIGQWSGPLETLLLTTVGRRSGERRTVPLTYLRDGDAYVLVASNGGAERNPAWWLNLEKTPQAELQVGSTTLTAVARKADAAERARLWPKLKAANPFYAAYERVTAREIPVVLLQPAGAAEGRRGGS
jgi:deazaflavin-dependent oxidoreductase (nitroreductase family)